MIPKTVRIAGVEWSVKEVHNLSGGEDMGICLKKDHEIHLDKGLQDDVKHLTLVHECMHAVCCTAGIRDDEKLTEEEYTSRTEYAFYTLLRDNTLV